VKDVLEGKAAKLQYLQADATCLEALKVMAEDDVEAVLVADSGGSVGIFSERNFARNSIHAKQLPAAILLGQVMIPCNVVANLGDSVQQCITLMNENQLRYLPVREEGNLIAILSLEDLLYEMVSYLERVFKENQLDLQVASLRGTYSC
jgi:CBS domain-containing protein